MSGAPSFAGISGYDLNARLRPALFVLLPLMLLPAVWLPAVRTALGGLTTLLCASGATYLLAQFARQAGRRVQSRFASTIGPEHTAQLLSSTDQSVDAGTKARYRHILTCNGLHMPTSDEEAENAGRAMGDYRAAVTWLRAVTRNEKAFPLLAKENTGYGFRRNLLGLKVVGVPVVLLALGVNSLALCLRWPTLDTQFWTGLGLEIGLFGATLAWSLLVNRRFVEDASQSYGERLLACCDELAAKPGRLSKNLS